MFSTLRNRFGIPGVISVIALVFAMFGGAYAASNSSDGGKATASAKVKKGSRGPKGATGPTGLTGLAGPTGAKGDKGEPGADGVSGGPGSTGPAGKSVIAKTFEGTEESDDEPCEERGGSSFEVQGSGAKTYACNGIQGEGGGGGGGGLPETLPPNKTETGVWDASIPPHTGEQSTSFSTVSFNIPLVATPTWEYIPPPPETNPDPVHCPGDVESPQAASGWICFYAAEQTNLSFAFAGQVYKSGARLLAFPEDGTEAADIYGTYAVTG
ncbi:MAG TPA: collagen-like protein [Solirubrobacterales bacterium]|nr:collagen-like protein [Solirubrobacterales bacterium]